MSDPANAGKLCFLEQLPRPKMGIQPAKLDGHDPYAYLRDVLARLPTHLVRDIDELLPHR